MILFKQNNNYIKNIANNFICQGKIMLPHKMDRFGLKSANWSNSAFSLSDVF